MYIKAFPPEIQRSNYNWKTIHCAKSAHIRSFSGPYFSAFRLNTERYGEITNAGKYGPEKLQIRTLFTQRFSHGESVSVD